MNPDLDRRHLLRLRPPRTTATAAGASALGLFGALASPAHAQAGLARQPVTVVVPFPPAAAPTPSPGRCPRSSRKHTGQAVASSTTGAAPAARWAPASRPRPRPTATTLFMGAVHHTIAPTMYPKLDYDIETDFIPLGLVASVPQVIVVNPKRVQATDLQELLELVRKNPGKLNYGSAGNGTSHHLAGELFKLQTKTFITHIPYRGAGPALQDLIAGQVDMMFDGLGSSRHSTSRAGASRR